MAVTIEQELAEHPALHALDFLTPHVCDMEACGATASHMVRCGSCHVGLEYLCGWCLTFAYADAREEADCGALTFNHTCGHTCHIDMCTVTPLG